MKWNQGCFDFAFFKKQTLMTLQFTIAEKHTLKIQFIKDLRNAIEENSSVSVINFIHVGVVGGNDDVLRKFMFQNPEGLGRRSNGTRRDFTLKTYKSSELVIQRSRNESFAATSLGDYEPLNDLSVTELPQGSGWEFGSTINKSRDSDRSKESDEFGGIRLTVVVKNNPPQATGPRGAWQSRPTVSPAPQQEASPGLALTIPHNDPVSTVSLTLDSSVTRSFADLRSQLAEQEKASWREQFAAELKENAKKQRSMMDDITDLQKVVAEQSRKLEEQ
eukprot:scaffold7403_cov122-Cylindrotheca_fusiformis.AAC.4